MNRTTNNHFIEIESFTNLIDNQNDEIKTEIIKSWGVKEEEIELEEIIESDEVEEEKLNQLHRCKHICNSQ